MRPPKTDLRFLIYAPKNILSLSYIANKKIFLNANLLGKYQQHERYNGVIYNVIS